MNSRALDCLEVPKHPSTACSKNEQQVNTDRPPLIVSLFALCPVFLYDGNTNISFTSLDSVSIRVNDSRFCF